MTRRMSATQARDNFDKLLDSVSEKGARVRLIRQGKHVAALVPVEDLELVEKIEDRLDLEEARAALVESRKKGTIPWKKLKAELGL